MNKCKAFLRWCKINHCRHFPLLSASRRDSVSMFHLASPCTMPTHFRLTRSYSLTHINYGMNSSTEDFALVQSWQPYSDVVYLILSQPLWLLNCDSAIKSTSVINAYLVINLCLLMIFGLSSKNDEKVQIVEKCKSNSPTGNRTRVFRVKAEYPNRLDYRGTCTCHRKSYSLIPGRWTVLW